MRYSNTVLIKPSSYLCNLKCRYCFYFDEENNRTKKYGNFMDFKTLENILSKFFKETKNELNLVFQGGEPLLIGLDFYKKLIEIVNKLNINKINVFYSLQTNGTLINEEMCSFFKENNFLIGVSLDGNLLIHDKNRVDKNGNGSYKKVVEGIKLLKKYNVDFNVLTVISKEVANNAEQVYQNYKNNNFKYLQFIPLIDNLNDSKQAVSNDEFFNFQKIMFDHWYEDLINDDRWSERYFDSLLNRIALNDYCDCTMSKDCGIMYAIEANGDVYPCDFYMTDNYLLGNINFDSISELDEKRNDINFLEKPIDKNCLSCKFYKLCFGGCKRNLNSNKNIYCDGYKRFFEYSLTKYEHIIELIKEGKV